MQNFPPALETLTEQFAKLPGIGRKSAQRLAFHVLSLPEEEAQAFADAILAAKHSITYCPVCQNLTEGEGPCSICQNPKRDHGVICVVAEPTTSSPWSGCGSTTGCTMCSTGSSPP
jgi:recombination protein RecR